MVGVGWAWSGVLQRLRAQGRSDPPPSGQCSGTALMAQGHAQAPRTPEVIHAGPTSGAIALDAIFTQEDFKNMANPCTGGKAACQKQRELRARLLATADIREEHQTAFEFDWKAELKSLPTGAVVFGTGVCKFIFRSLRDVRDPDYIKFDSGERHIFEVTRTDGGCGASTLS